MHVRVKPNEIHQFQHTKIIWYKNSFDKIRLNMGVNMHFKHQKNALKTNHKKKLIKEKLIVKSKLCH